MKIGVCIKQVPDTATKIQVQDGGAGIVESGVKFIVSPYDEFAVEEALKTKEKMSGSEVVVMTVGPKRSQEALRNALAMGCDRAIHILQPDGNNLDSSAVAKLLAKQIEKEGLELVFTGRHAVDDDNAQVSQMVGEFLSWPHVTMVAKFELDGSGKQAKVERQIEGGASQSWDVELPAVFAATKGINEPRYASLKGIMQAKSKPLQEVALTDAGVSEADLAPKVKVSNYRLPEERKAGQIFKDDVDKGVSEVVRLLREEAKVV